MNINLKNNISRMNKHIYHILVLFVVTSTLLVGCGHNSTNKIGAFQFTSLQVDKTSHLFADDTKPACQLIMDITYVKQSSDDSLKDSINNYIKSFCLGDRYITMPIQQAIQSYATFFLGVDVLKLIAKTIIDLNVLGGVPRNKVRRDQLQERIFAFFL